MQLKKTFDDLENLYREKFKKKNVIPGTEGSAVVKENTQTIERQ